MNFADRLLSSITTNRSILCAGFDPIIDDLPPFIIAEGATHATSEDAVYSILSRFYELALEALEGTVAAIKPNIAFFEQYSVGGIRAFSTVTQQATSRGIPVIADVKRGDIGSTAQAYARAYLSTTATARLTSALTVPPFAVDAITINPFLGFDSIEPFVVACEESGKGLFVLIRTSNPGSRDIQGLVTTAGSDVSTHVARWLGEHEHRLRGHCGWSGLGAVVGATHPDIARSLRTAMPGALFLIPGFGAQGASASDSCAALDERRLGGVVNASRAVFQGTNRSDSPAALQARIRENVASLNSELGQPLP